MAASGLVEIDEARRAVLDAVRVLPAEQVELRSSLGRVLAQDVVAAEPVPPFDGSAMDGYAVRAADLPADGVAAAARLRVVDESRAGAPARSRLDGGEAIAISTGAMMPAGADAVVPIEEATMLADGAVELHGRAQPGRNVRRAGEDVPAGRTVLRSGRRLGAAELGVLASLDRDPVSCALRPRVSLLVSGDELLAQDERERPGAIRDSNSLTLAALVRDAGGELVHEHLMRDEREQATSAIAAALADVDVAVICGGVSVGVHDLVRPALESLGAERCFWGLALKPGRPTWFGTFEGALVFGLPGNPVSAMVTFVLLVAPALRALQGRSSVQQRPTALMECDYEKPAGRAHAVRCRLRACEDGWHAEPTGPQGSHVLTSMLDADALALIPSASCGARAGERVEIEPLRSCLPA